MVGVGGGRGGRGVGGLVTSQVDQSCRCAVARSDVESSRDTSSSLAQFPTFLVPKLSIISVYAQRRNDFLLILPFTSA